MKLIDADALKANHGMKDDCNDCDKEVGLKSVSCEYNRIYTLMDFCEWIEDAPTIEPEILTCEDCKYADDKPILDGRHWCNLHGFFMYYCSDAERKKE